jgi:ketosteroid isomerase-like protein
MNKYFLILFIVYFFTSCGSSEKINPAKEKEAMKEAFLKYMDTSAVMLRPGRMPLKGMDAAQFIYNQNDSSYILTWVPRGAEIASSGDMGYTDGIWTAYQKKWLSDSVSQGTYVTIWEKQANGTWKFVLDTGNDGVDRKK